VNARAHSKLLKMTRCDIKPRSIERSKDEKKSKGLNPQIPFLKHRNIFLRSVKTILEA
jgi:hypothetical protein